MTVAAIAGDTSGNDWTALLAELDGFAKAFPPVDDKSGDGKAAGDKEDDKKIQAAAADGDKSGQGDGDEDDDKAKKRAELFGKSFQVTLADGTQADAIDGTEAVMAIADRVVDLTGHSDTIFKALEVFPRAFRSMQATIAEQDQLIKALRTDLDKVSNNGRGRSAVLTLLDKPSPAGAATTEAPGVPWDDFMTKALELQADGKLIGLDIARCQAYRNRGMAPPEEISRVVLPHLKRA